MSPQGARLLLRVFLRGEAYESIAGDLEEEFRTKSLPRRWFWKQSLASIAAYWTERLFEFPRTSPSGEGLMQTLLQDLHLAFRLLRKQKGFTMVAVSVLALAIGANTVVFALVNALFLRPLPVPEPDRLVRIYSGWSSGEMWSWVSYPDYTDIRDRARVFSGVILEKPTPLSLSAGGENERAWGSVASGNYFSVLGLTPALGRFFLPEEDLAPGGHPVVVLSHRYWQSRFGADPSVVGRELVLNGRPFVVVGVAPSGFDGTNLGFRPDLWAPVMMQRELMPGFDVLTSRKSRGLYVLARLATGESIERARAELDVLARELDVLARELEASYPESDLGLRFSVIPEAEGTLHPSFRSGALGLSAVLELTVGLVLLLACANVAGLFLTRAAVRRKEIGVRLALGASRGRLVRQLLTEATLVALTAGVLSVLLAGLAAAALTRSRLPVDFPVAFDFALDARVLAFALLASLLTGTLFGLAPALQSSRPELAPVLRDVPGGAAFRRLRLRSVLVVGQIMASTVLLIGAGLFTRSLANARRIDPGFNPDRVVISSVDLSLQGYTEEKGKAFYRRLRERAAALPGVSAVSFAQLVPFDFDIQRWHAAPEGYAPPPGKSLPSLDRNIVSTDYFKALSIPILEGRDFTEQDDPGALPVAVVNETLARQFWPKESALGKRFGVPGSWMREVVGVVKDGKYLSLGEDPKPYFYLPENQVSCLDLTIHVRTEGDPHALLRRIREEVRALDESLPVYDTKLLADHVSVALAPARGGASVLSAFGLLALVLAALGLYGILAFAVTERTHEIGIRRALGAQKGAVLRLVLRQGLVLVAAGLATGLLSSLWASRLLASVLYGVSSFEPQVFALAAGTLFLVSLFACYLPARRATRVDPLVALRYE